MAALVGVNTWKPSKERKKENTKQTVESRGGGETRAVGSPLVLEIPFPESQTRILTSIHAIRSALVAR